MNNVPFARPLRPRLSKVNRVRIVEAIDQLAKQPHVGKLLNGGLTGLRRIRIGSYRVIYEIDDGEVVILVLRIVHLKSGVSVIEHSAPRPFTLNPDGFSCRQN